MTTLSEQVTELVARLQVHLAGLDRPVLVTTGAPLANEGEPGTYALDVVGRAFYGPKASSGVAPWGAPSIFGGVDGREVQFDVSATHIRWRYVGDASWTNLIALSALRGQDGDPGANGWTPVLAVVVDGDRRVHRVVDWTGGAGTKPATGSYVGPLGLVAAIGDATNIRGPAGAGTGDMQAANNLSDLVDDAAARTNLDVYSKGEGDARYVLDSGLNEKVDDRVNALIVAGAGISKTYDDAANTLTLAATGGGGGAQAQDGAIFGLRPFPTAGSVTTSVTISAGKCRDSTNVDSIELTAPLAKRLDAVWAAGSGNGGREAGSSLATQTPGQTWHLYVILNPSLSVVDGLWSLSPTAPTLPAGYTRFRRVLSIPFILNTQNLPDFVWVDEEIHYKTRSTDMVGVADGTAAGILRAISVPLGLKVRARLYHSVTGTTTAGVWFAGVYDPDVGVPTFGVSTQWAQHRIQSDEADERYQTTVLECWTNTAQQVFTACNDTLGQLTMGVLSYRDARGRFG